MGSGMDEATKATTIWSSDVNQMAKKNAESIGRKQNRIKRHEYFMGVAVAVAARATCPRRSVGAVLVVDGRIVSSGYNGSPRGLPHCDVHGCEMVNGHCVSAVHAEANCLLQAAEHGASTRGATLYTTASPCRGCMSLIINAGVKCVVYAEPYQSDDHAESNAGNWAMEAAEVSGVVLHRVSTGQTKEKISKAAKVAALAIYFSDASDYKTALWEVVGNLAPDAIEYLERNKLPPQFEVEKEDL